MHEMLHSTVCILNWVQLQKCSFETKTKDSQFFLSKVPSHILYPMLDFKVNGLKYLCLIFIGCMRMFPKSRLDFAGPLYIEATVQYSKEVKIQRKQG